VPIHLSTRAVVLNDILAATDSSSKDDRDAWLNLNAFAATLTATIKDPELAIFGIWTIRTAIENKEEPDSVAVSAAALWLVLAAPFLHELSTQGKDFDGKVAKPGALFENEDWRGFNKSRWQFWMNRLRQLQSWSNGEASDLLSQATDTTDSL
jgi:hypothetical protein